MPLTSHTVASGVILRTFAGAGRISMQSTGQGGMQSSQPVHSSAITVCMYFDAPRIASTGHAWMHFVQPIQADSSIHATAGRSGITPNFGSTDLGGRDNRLASARAVSSPPGGH